VGGPVRGPCLRFPAGPQLPGRGRVPPSRAGRQVAQADVDSRRGPGKGVRQNRSCLPSGAARHVPGQGHDCRVAQGGGARGRKRVCSHGRGSTPGGHYFPAAPERRAPRPGGRGRGPLLRWIFPGSEGERGLPGHRGLRRRPGGLLPLQAAGRGSPREAGKVAGRKGPVLQRGQDEDHLPRGGVRFPRLELPPLPGGQDPGQAVEGLRQEAPETARGGDAQTARLERGRGDQHAQPGNTRMVRISPAPGVHRRVSGARELHVEAHLEVGLVEPPGQGEALDRREVLREVLPGQGRQVGVRRPGHRRLPAEPCLDGHPAPRHGQGPGIAR
jgi:hypothetical protein